MKIAIGADGSGFDLKESVIRHLAEKGIDFTDFTPTRDGLKEYYETVPTVIPLLLKGDYDYAILMCGTGMGMAQIANSYKGIRAAVCESVFTAKMSRAINNSNVLAMGGFVVTPWIGNLMVDTFLSTQIAEDDSLASFHDFLLEAQDHIKELENKIYK